MGVSGEFKYLGPLLSSVASVRPVNAMTFPFSLAIGNITRLRNFEYIAETAVVGRCPRTVLRSGAKRSREPALSWPKGTFCFRMFPRKQPALPQRLFVELSAKMIPEQKPRIRRIADAKLGNGFIIQSAPFEVFPRMGALRPTQTLLKKLASSLMDIEQGCAMFGLPCLLRA